MIWLEYSTSATHTQWRRQERACNILVKNEEVNCAKFSNFDLSCGQNLQTMSANCFSLWGLRPPDPLLGLRAWDPTGSLPSPDRLVYSPSNEYSWRRHCPYIHGAVEKWTDRFRTESTHRLMMRISSLPASSQ